jgi:DNA-binding NarL/FixJ family response regulator
MSLHDAIAYALSSAATSRPAAVAQSRRHGPGKDGSPLSRRELEVAKLVAHGLTNREVAETLVISERTADAHVANILGKLHLRGRAQIGAWIVERGLYTPD